MVKKTKKSKGGGTSERSGGRKQQKGPKGGGGGDSKKKTGGRSSRGAGGRKSKERRPPPPRGPKLRTRQQTDASGEKFVVFDEKVTPDEQRGKKRQAPQQDENRQAEKTEMRAKEVRGKEVRAKEVRAKEKLSKSTKKTAAAASGAEESTTGTVRTWQQRKRFLKTTHVLYSKLLETDKKSVNEVREAVGRLLALVTQHCEATGEELHALCCKDGFSRVLQMCLKFSKGSQRDRILALLKPTFLDFANSRYGHKLAIKMFLYGSRTDRAEFIKVWKSFKGRTLFFTKYAAAAWEYCYSKSSQQTQKELLQNQMLPNTLKEMEAVTERSYAELVKGMEEENRQKLIGKLETQMQRVVDKEMLGLVQMHSFLRNAITVLPEEKLKEWMEMISEGASQLMTTKDGNSALMTLLGFATPKQKKKFLRDIKTQAADLAINPINCYLILRLLTIVDDTRLLKDCILEPIYRDIAKLSENKSGRRVLAHFLCPLSTWRFVPPDEKNALRSPSPTSLKDPHTRHEELRPLLVKSLIEHLSSDETMGEWIQDFNRCRMLPDVFSSIASLSLTDRDERPRLAFFSSFGNLLASLEENGRVAEIFEDRNMRSNLFFLMKREADAAPPNFAASMWKMIRSRLVDLDSVLESRGTFVFCDIYDLSDDDTRNEMKDLFLSAPPPPIALLLAADTKEQRHKAANGHLGLLNFADRIGGDVPTLEEWELKQ